MKPTLLLCLTLVLSSGCLLKKKSSGSPTATTSSNSTNTGGGSGGSGGGSGNTTPEGNTVVTKAYGAMFVTAATTNGGFGWTGSYPGDLTPGDTMCATEATNRGLTGIFNAVVGETTLRNKASGNWILKKSAEYRRPDGTVIGTTDSTGSLVFPLTNSIDASSVQYWTGLATNSDVDAFYACSGWGNGMSGDGKVGESSATTSAAISSTTAGCNESHPLLCAEKIPRTTTVPAQKAYRKIFPSSIAMTAGSGLLNADGAVRFDEQCQADANANNLSDNGYTTYKALVMTNTTTNNVRRRVACSTAYCGTGPGEAIGWVLEANTEYRRANGTTVIGTTNANAIFDFPLTNSFTGVDEEYWTGFTDTWAQQANTGVGSCVFFQIKVNDGTTAYVGNGSSVDSGAVNTLFPAYCSAERKILCIEQKRTQNVYVDYPGY